MRTNKKGVSPLIATVLLIAFAVALGAVVMNWGRSYVEETAAKAKLTSDTKVSCSMDIGMKYVVLNGNKKICYNTTEKMIKFTLLNSGSKNIQGIQAKIYGTENIMTYELDNSSITPAGVLKSNMSYDDTTYGTIEKVSLTPSIKIEGTITPVLCADNSLDVEEINTC